MAIGQGANLGEARGSISISTAGAQAAVPEIKRVGQSIKRELEGTGAAATQVGQKIEVTAAQVSAAMKKTGGDFEAAVKLAVQELETAQKSLHTFGQGVGRNIPRELGPASQAVDDFIDKIRTPPFTRFGQAARAAFDQAKAAAGQFGAAVQDGLRRAGQGFSKLGQDIRSIRGELLAIGVGAGILSKLGLDGARNLRNFRVAFGQLLGSQEEAVKLMSRLTTTANEFGLEMEGVWQLSRSLLPILKGNTQELDAWVKRAAMLRSVFPIAQKGAETRAISEFISGQTMSLQRLFNVPPELIQQAKAQFSDYGQQLDFILAKMGATEAGARAQADAWVSLRNELTLLLAEGFTPLFQQLQPILTRFREFITALRETHPEIANIGAAAIAAAAVGAPLLIFLGQIISALETIKKLSFAGTLGRAGAFGIAAAAGVGLGVAVTQQIGKATGREDLANASVGDLWSFLKQALFVVVAGVSEVFLRIAGLFTAAAEAFNKGIASMIGSMAGFVRALGEIVPDVLGGAKLRDAAESLEGFSKWLDENASRGSDLVDTMRANRDQMLENLNRSLFPPGQQAPAGGGPGAGLGDTAVGFDDAQTKAIVEYFDRVKEIERNEASARLQATRQYEQQRTQTIAEFNRQAAREEQDFNRQRTRQHMQFLRDVERITRERVQRETKWLEELNKRVAKMTAETNSRIATIRAEGDEKIADMRDEGNARILQQEEDFQRAREQRQAEHRNRLLEAAARLDASAVANELRQFRMQEAQATQEHTIRLQREREGIEKRIAAEQAGVEKRIAQEEAGLQERLQQEQEAHAERVAEARAADQQRIADMREALRLQQRMEDEDRAIRLARTREDHNRQLEAMRQANVERLNEIKIAAANEKAELKKRFQAELLDLGIASQQYLTLQKKKEADALRSFEQYWSDWNKIISDQEASAAVPEFQHGGFAGFTGLAKLHGTAGRPETVLDQGTTAMLRSMLGGNFTPQTLVGAVAGGGGRSVTVGDITIPIYTQPGQDANDIAAAVDGRLREFFREAAG